MSEGNPHQVIPFDVEINILIEDYKQKLKHNYCKGKNNTGAWFEGSNSKEPLGWYIQTHTEKLFTQHGKSKDWVINWIHAIKKVAAVNKDATIDDVTFIVDDWETYYKNSN